MTFDDDLFFYFVLPPIVFSSGFNMYRKKFFGNLGNILLFGVIGTFIAFASFSSMTIWAIDYFEPKQYQIIEGCEVTAIQSCEIRSTVVLSHMEIFLMCSLLCSSDVIAAISMVSPKEQPKLFSLVFGEGIVNDAVSIILFNTVVQFTKKDTEFTAMSVPEVAVEFIDLGFYSIMIGFLLGCMVSYLFKKARSLTKSPVVECALIFCVAYIAYVSAELLHFSGIISLLTVGVTVAHYGWYSLSPQGKTSSTIVF
mmetsp:Transcript_97734/g.134454  ORF Transcript_97734/g.134454 Transcript_97734/m.134454 type:complete len:254 (+) Transcript_97734:181-942(+)